MVKGTTETGFKFEIDPDVIRDMEFIELLAEAMEDGSKLPAVLVSALGKSQKKALYDHVRNDKGRVMLDDINREFLEILGALKDNPETKN